MYACVCVYQATEEVQVRRKYKEEFGALPIKSLGGESE